jgi:hypothetical protein
MAQLNPAEVATKISNFIHAIGAEFHTEEKDGESFTRVQLGKSFASSPQSIFQGVGGYALFNFPGSTDQALAAAIGFFGSGNSSANSSPSSAPLSN